MNPLASAFKRQKKQQQGSQYSENLKPAHKFSRWKVLLLALIKANSLVKIFQLKCWSLWAVI